MAQFSLQWDGFKQSICNGLSSLQQNGDMVDVTLAADGHLVRVHRLVLSLASPYLKEILASAVECKHPVIFLNNVSYPVLCGILEYVYTGQAVVTRDLLPDFVQAAKALRIKGLDDVEFDYGNSASQSQGAQKVEFEIQKAARARTSVKRSRSPEPAVSYSINVEETTPDIPHIKILNRKEKTPTTSLPSLDMESSFADQSDHHTFDDTAMDTDTDKESDWTRVKPKLDKPGEPPNQNFSFGISFQGGLQLILNRYIYNCRYTSMKGADKGHRQWRCVEYAKPRVRCKALVVTTGDNVVKRSGIHNHPFHDKRILQKVQNNAVYANLKDAENKSVELRTKNKE